MVHKMCTGWQESNGGCPDTARERFAEQNTAKGSKRKKNELISLDCGSFCAFVFRVAGVGQAQKKNKKRMSRVEFRAGDVNGGSPSSTDEVSAY